MSPPEARRTGATVSDRYRALLDVGRTLAATLSLEELYAAIHGETARVIEMTGFYVSLYDESRDLATVVFYADRGDVRRANVSYRGSDSAVLRSREPCMVRDRLEERAILRLGEDDGVVARSAVSAPMLHKGCLIGALCAQSREPGAYSEEDLALLRGIADLSAVAISNARHVNELERRRLEAERIEEIGRALASSLDPREVLGKVVAAVTEVLHVDGVGVWLCDDPPGHVAELAASGGDDALLPGLTWDTSGPMGQELVAEHKTVVIDDLESNREIPHHLREYMPRGSGMAAPLLVGGKAVGVLTARSRQPRRFTADDREVLRRLASQASVALENARLHTQVQALSLTDPLSGLPNRRRLQIHLDKEVAAARRGRSLVLVLFDIDEFKRYNDTLGHVAGDEILRAFAQILEAHNRAMNLVVRYGGDEFISILSDTDREGAEHYVRRIREHIAADAVMGPLNITVSTGLAVFDPESMRTTEDVVRAADEDMYRSKAARAVPSWSPG
jgi:diguanylate cyclase (GGDEF)-like protein